MSTQSNLGPGRLVTVDMSACVYLLVEDSSSDLHQHCGQVMSRLTVTHLLQEHFAAVVNHFPDQSQTSFPEKHQNRNIHLQLSRKTALPGFNYRKQFLFYIFVLLKLRLVLDTVVQLMLCSQFKEV